MWGSRDAREGRENSVLRAEDPDRLFCSLNKGLWYHLLNWSLKGHCYGSFYDFLGPFSAEVIHLVSTFTHKQNIPTKLRGRYDIDTIYQGEQTNMYSFFMIISWHSFTTGTNQSDFFKFKSIPSLTTKHKTTVNSFSMVA